RSGAVSTSVPSRSNTMRDRLAMLFATCRTSLAQVAGRHSVRPIQHRSPCNLSRGRGWRAVPDRISTLDTPVAGPSGERRNEPMDLEGLKREAAARALEDVRDGMRLGLGTGSTARHFVELLGERVRTGLKVVGVPTSEATRAQAEQCGIVLTTLDDTP